MCSVACFERMRGISFGDESVISQKKIGKAKGCPEKVSRHSVLLGLQYELSGNIVACVREPCDYVLIGNGLFGDI